jgi:hypothetical protein
MQILHDVFDLIERAISREEAICFVRELRADNARRVHPAANSLGENIQGLNPHHLSLNEEKGA